MFKGNIGTRTGRNVLEGKKIHCDSAGFDHFEDYFTDSDSSSPEKTSVETVRQNEIKSFINIEKSVHEGNTTLFKFPSRKRLSFKTDAISDSDSSSINSFQPRNRLISKRGMQSFPGEDEEEEKMNMEQQFSPLIDPVKRSSPYNKSFISLPQSENKYSQMISKRGMKSFPGDEGVEEVEEDDIPVFEIIDSSSPELIREKMVEYQQQNLLSDGGKENEENLAKIQNDENTKKSPQKSLSHVSPTSTKVTSKSVKRHSMPVQNWYMWDNTSSLIDRAKIIITPYGVYEDTGVKNNLPNLVTNLLVIDEDESQQESPKNWKSKLPDLDLSEDSNVESNENATDQKNKEKRKSSSQKEQEKKKKRKSQMSSQKKGSAKQIVKRHKELQSGSTSLSDDEERPPEDFTESEETSPDEELLRVDKTSGKKKSLSSSENRSETKKLSPTKNSLKKTISSTDKARQKLNDIRKIPKPKIRVLPRRQKSLGTKTSPISKKQSPVKQSLGSMNKRSLSLEQKQNSTTSSQSNTPAQPVSKKDSSPRQGKKRSLPGVKKICPPLTKGNVSPSQQNKPAIIRKGNKRKASESPETKIPAKRAKTNNKTVPRPSNLLTRVSASKEKKESITSPSKKQKKGISQPTNGDETNSVLPANPDLLQSESEICEAISLGFDSSASNKKSSKNVVLSSKGSDIIDSSPNASDRIDILRIFDSKELNPKLDKTDEKNEKISSCSQSNSVDGPKKPQQKKPDSATKETLPRRRRTSGPLSSEDSLMTCNQGYPKRSSTEKSKSPAKSNRVSERRTSGPLPSEDSLMAFNEGYPKKISAEKSKSPAKSNRVTERRTSGPLPSEDSLIAFNEGYPKKISAEKSKSPAKSNRVTERWTSGPLPSEDSLMAFNEGYHKRISAEKSKSPAKSNRVSDRQTSESFSSKDSLMSCNQGYPKRSSTEKSKSPAKSNRVSGYPKMSSTEKSKSPAKSNRVSEGRTSGPLFSEDSLVTYNKEYLKVSNSHEGPPDWQCQGCDGLIPHCLMTCIFCGFRRQESFKEDPKECNSNSEEETIEWQCQDCNCLIPVSLKACIFCDLCSQESSQGAETQMPPQGKSPSTIYRTILSQLRGKNRKQSPKRLKEKPQNEQKTPSKIVGGTSKSQSLVLQKTSPKSMKKQNSFYIKTNYTFNSYTNIKVDHKISYCVCSQSDTAMVGMMKLQKGGCRNTNCSLKEMFFTVLEGQVKVQVDDEKRLLATHDTFFVAENGEYSIENASTKTACLIFTIIK